MSVDSSGAFPLPSHSPVLSFAVVLQVYSTVKSARLLMCAPQNFSADLLFRALSAAGIPKDYMIRLNDPRVPPTQVCGHLTSLWKQ